MEKKLEHIREHQKETWNATSSGWKQWDEITMNFLKPVGDGIIQFLNPTGRQVVLDIAAGTGEPGLTIAEKLNGGKVISADLADEMLAIARENAAKRGIKNFETKTCDVCELPFSDNTFDAVSCRFGFMFFPDTRLAAKELARTLKPGGKIAVAVWGAPDKNYWFTATLDAVRKRVQLPTPEPDAPGLFRCAAPGMMLNLFKEAGLKNLSETEMATTLRPGSVDVYWTFMADLVGPVLAALREMDEATRLEIKNEVCEKITQKYPDGTLAIEGSAILICGEK